MTWIVGAPTMFGYSFGISDVRVTLGDGSEVDCLQKTHPIGRHLAAGFAGSVRIGFAMIDELRRLANFEDPELRATPMLYFSNGLWRLARCSAISNPRSRHVIATLCC